MLYLQPPCFGKRIKDNSSPVKELISLKIVLFIIPFLFISALSVFAEDEIPETDNSRTALGIGLEWNMNSPSRYAGGALLAFDFDLTPAITLGINSTFSTNFFGYTVIEPAAMFRWYFLNWSKIDKKFAGFFLQADAGAFVIIESKGVSVKPLGGLRGGFRFPLGSMFYVEPYGRVGYPFMFGVGAAAGIRFKNKEKSKDNALVAELEAVIEEKRITDVSVEATNRGVMITLSNIMFRADSAVLPDLERQKLREIAAILSSIQNVKILIAGHSTQTGEAAYLLELSKNRAQSVADYLVSLGAVGAANTTVVGYGSSRPIADNSTPQGMAANRRVEIIILRD